MDLWRWKIRELEGVVMGRGKCRLRDYFQKSLWLTPLVDRPLGLSPYLTDYVNPPMVDLGKEKNMEKERQRMPELKRVLQGVPQV